MTKEIAPCWHCGGDVELTEYETFRCKICGTVSMMPDSDRQKRNAENGLLINNFDTEHHIDMFNTRYKRTCKPHIWMDEQITESIARWIGECECGAIIGEGTNEYEVSLCFPNFCPSCGAEVVDE